MQVRNIVWWFFRNFGVWSLVNSSRISTVEALYVWREKDNETGVVSLEWVEHDCSLPLWTRFRNLLLDEEKRFYAARNYTRYLKDFHRIETVSKSETATARGGGGGRTSTTPKENAPTAAISKRSRPTPVLPVSATYFDRPSPEVIRFLNEVHDDYLKKNVNNSEVDPSIFVGLCPFSLLPRGLIKRSEKQSENPKKTFSNPPANSSEHRKSKTIKVSDDPTEGVYTIPAELASEGAPPLRQTFLDYYPYMIDIFPSYECVPGVLSLLIYTFIATGTSLDNKYWALKRITYDYPDLPHLSFQYYSVLTFAASVNPLILLNRGKHSILSRGEYDDVTSNKTKGPPFWPLFSWFSRAEELPFFDQTGTKVVKPKFAQYKRIAKVKRAIAATPRKQEAVAAQFKTGGKTSSKQQAGALQSDVSNDLGRITSLRFWRDFLPTPITDFTTPTGAPPHDLGVLKIVKMITAKIKLKREEISVATTTGETAIATKKHTKATAEIVSKQPPTDLAIDVGVFDGLDMAVTLMDHGYFTLGFEPMKENRKKMRRAFVERAKLAKPYMQRYLNTTETHGKIMNIYPNFPNDYPYTLLQDVEQNSRTLGTALSRKIRNRELAHPENFSLLKHRFHQLAAGVSDVPNVLSNVTMRDDMSSFAMPKYILGGVNDFVQTQQIIVTTLDKVFYQYMNNVTTEHPSNAVEITSTSVGRTSTSNPMPFPYIHILKLDIEGLEFHALAGATRLLREKRIAFMVMEYYPAALLTAGTDYKQIFDFLGDPVVGPFQCYLDEGFSLDLPEKLLNLSEVPYAEYFREKYDHVLHSDDGRLGGFTPGEGNVICENMGFEW